MTIIRNTHTVCVEKMQRFFVCFSRGVHMVNMGL